MKAKHQHIPGMNYIGDKNRKQMLETGPVTKQTKPVSQSNSKWSGQSTPLLPTPGTQYMEDNRMGPLAKQKQGFLSVVPQFGGLPTVPDRFSTNPFSQPPPLLTSQIYSNSSQYTRQAPAIIERSDSDTPGTEPVAKIDNPLAMSHEFKMVCQLCIRTPLPGLYDYNPTPHKCEENMLAMRLRGTGAPWVLVRERKNHREFPGNYLLCKCITFKNPMFCKYGEERCSFAHNDVEQRLWTLEKDGQFNVTEFIMQNRKNVNLKGFSLKEILVKHGGYFEFICRSCYYSSPPIIANEGPENECGGRPPHSWIDFKILAHIGPGGVVTLVNPRGFLHKSAFFKICKWLHFCRTRVNAECRFAHAVVERDVWMLERDTDLSREEIVKQSKQIQNIVVQSSSEAAPVSQSVAQSSSTSGSSGWAAVAGSENTNSNTQKVAGSTEVPSQEDNLCPVTIVEVCQTCWKFGQKTMQEGDKDRCLKGHANWNHNRTYLISPSYKELRPLPKKIPSGLNFIECKNIREKGKCGYTGVCQFAHCQEELEAWKWMCMNGIDSIELVAEASKAAQKLRADSVKPKISGQSVVSSSQVSSSTAVRPSLPVGNIYTFYCHYCGVTCNSQKQWDDHRASDKHNFNVDSDKEHQWNFRQPPWNKSGLRYQLCARHVDGNKCQYSNAPDMYNLCPDAHNQEELDEWKERYEWRQMKREMARQEQVFSYMDQLLEKYEASHSSVKVITESLEDVEVTEDGDLNIYKDEKKSSQSWTFMVKTKRTLEKVSLLYNRDRLHFFLLSAGKACQIAQGETFAVSSTSDQRLYKVQVQFNGGMFGSFQQWIIFDFGSQPVLCRKITVEVGNQDAQLKVKQLREQLTFDRWTSQNREIVRHDIDCNHPVEGQLLTKYKEPSSSETVVTQTTVMTELNRHNYRQKMHKLLELEEMTRHQIISSYNLCTTIECLDKIQEEVFVYAHPGELFAKVPLQEHLTEDTDAGKLILSSVRTVLLAMRDDSNKIVYEAAIVREENFNYDGRGRDYIYLCLSPKCVRQLKIKTGLLVNVEIQFQMDRMSFCRMHYAVDQLASPDIVFPDVPKINPLRNEIHNLTIRSHILNPDQMEAVRHIVADRTGYTPPFVIYGPFGTGKTETLAQAAMVLLKEKPDARILICAQSNSAADLYIVKHLDNFLKRSKVKLRRVYFKERRVYTVDPKVKNYCLLSQDQSSFTTPTKEDILAHRIVIVTVSTALVLINMGLQGHFTHIFIDEAAQTLECEALMPLAMATEKTCVVLAGDHQQISPKVYSEEAENQNLHMSLLERVYNYYDSYKSLISESSPLNILLSINYRTKMEILRFISAIFYGGPNSLKSEANIPSVVDITPLMFYGVQGREVQDPTSISYYNMSEVQEVVERVDDLYSKWPEEWGAPSAKQIGVVTPYYDQVQLIRKSLKKRNYDLRDVVVERIHGVQGREFRAMFLSTVRTRHLIDSALVQTGEAEDNSNMGDFGFLSDPKLLNTAFTRAQSLVVVIGDPVALCAIGDNVNIWRVYLKHCQNMSSLYPQNHTLESVKQQVQELLNSPAKGKLLQLANQKSQLNLPASSAQGNQKAPVLDYKAAAMQDTSVSQHQVLQTKAEVPPALRNGSVQHVEARAVPSSPARVPLSVPGRAPLSVPGRSVPPAPLRLPLQRKVETYFNIGDEFTVDGDDVLRQLAKLSRDNKTAGPAVTDEIKQELVRVVEDNGHIVIEYGNISNIGSGDAVQCYNKEELEQLVRFNPGKYVLCKMKIEEDQLYAEVMDARSQMSIIKIDGKQDCGGAMNNDEAIVEVVNVGSDGITGRVVGVVRRAMDLDRSIVCCVEDGHTGNLVPVNENIPRLYNVTIRSNLENNINGNVSVYKFTTSKQIRFSHFENCTENKVFVAKYLKWDTSIQLPLCVVIGVLPAGVDVNTGAAVLDIEHHIVMDHQSESLMEAEHTYNQNYQLADEVYHSREDLTARWCITIDNILAEDTTTAFSIDETGDGNYQIGVHISDISYFVPKDSNIDVEAKNRGVTMNSLNGVLAHMLPARLSTDLCSLKPDYDRVAVSVLMAVQSTGEVKQVLVQKSLVNIKRKFTYQEADEVLHDPMAHEDYLKSCVLVLYEISRMWRKTRLGNASFCQDLKLEEKLCPLSRQLVSEMLIMVDYHTAQVVSNQFPLACPFYCQPSPNIGKLTVWKHEYAAEAVNSMALTKPFLEGTATCRCKVACICIGRFIRQANLKVRETIDVNSFMWDSLTQANEVDHYSYVQSVIVEAENHPQLAVAQHKLNSIEAPSVYESSADAAVSKAHYSLNLNLYSQCTKPGSRYMDLVVQRLLVACVESSPCPYTIEEIKTLCSELKDVNIERELYENSILSLHLGLALRARPLLIQPIVEAVSKNVATLCLPSIPCMSKHLSSISITSLDPLTTTDFGNGTIALKWQERIYNMPDYQSQSAASDIGELNPDRFIYKIPAKHWQRLLMAIRDEDVMMYQKLKSAVEFVQKQVLYPATQGGYIEDVTSEPTTPGRIHQRSSEFTLKLSPFQVIQVQLTADLYHGLMSPVIQLVNITPTLDICVEHRNGPEKCFSDITALTTSPSQNHTDINAYLKCWEPIVNTEAAKRAVDEGNRLVIRGVNLVWQTETTFSGIEKIAQFSLPVSYMKERKIKLLPGMSVNELFNPSNSKRCQAYFGDFICVRYGNLSIPDDPTLSDALSLLVNNGVPVTWVGHCVITSVRMDRDFLIFKMRLQQSSVPLPDLLYKAVGSQMPSTIELIERSSIDRSVVLMQDSLKDTSSLTKAVILGQTPANNAHYNDVQQLKDYSRCIISLPNPGQDEALRRALQLPFVVINGGPQSGKSSIAAALACMFVQRNKQSGGGQVLLCAPNITSLHNIADIIQSTKGSKPKVVVIYDDNTVRQLHPLPGGATINRRHVSVIVENSLSLHNQTYNPAAPYSKALKEHENIFAYYPDNVTPDQIEKYLEIVSVAETLVIRDSELILCTCAASDSIKLIKHTNINQIIIDDSQMCSEPETLIPLSLYTSVKNIVLIGDQSQIKPRVISQYTRNLGLHKSLFQRYISAAIQLTVQYSVHEGIMDILQDCTDVGKLSCANISQRQPSILNWPGSRSKPTAFCHIDDAVEVVSQSGNGGQQGIINETEVDFVFRVAFGLVERYHVPQKSIAIVCTTIAQRDIILQKLEQTYTNFVVCTVLETQGKSFDYVLLTTVRWYPVSKIDRVPSIPWKRRRMGDLLEKGFVTMAMTRARKGLVVIGNKHLLSCTDVWRKILACYSKESKLVSAADFLNTIRL